MFAGSDRTLFRFRLHSFGPTAPLAGPDHADVEGFQYKTCRPPSRKAQVCECSQLHIRNLTAAPANQVLMRREIGLVPAYPTRGADPADKPFPLQGLQNPIHGRSRKPFHAHPQPGEDGIGRRMGGVLRQGTIHRQPLRGHAHTAPAALLLKSGTPPIHLAGSPVGSTPDRRNSDVAFAIDYHVL
jgi:hypothetical protein